MLLDLVLTASAISVDHDAVTSTVDLLTNEPNRRAQPPQSTRWDTIDRRVMELAPLVYDEMRRLAAAYLRRERPGHTLQPTALANEAYLRLADQKRVVWQDKQHVIGIAAQAMRRILIDAARRARTQVTLSGLGEGGQDDMVSLLDLDAALERLAERSERQSRVVELRFFGGLTVEETAKLLSVSPRTIKDDWRVARAWLRTELCRGDTP